MNPKNETLRLQSAEKLFERIEKQVREKEKFEFLFYETAAHSFYTPPSNVAAWLRKYDIEHPKGRDYEALTKAAKRKPVGYWEDAPRGAKFGGSGTAEKRGEVKPPEGPRAVPTSPPKSADGPWPKYALSPSRERKGLSVVYIQAEAGGVTTAYYTDGTKMTHRASNGVLAFGAIYTDIGVIIRALEQNGHADVAAELRAKATTPPADDEFERWLVEGHLGRFATALFKRGALQHEPTLTEVEQG